MNLRFVPVAIFLCAASSAIADIYKIENSTSTISFAVRHLLGTARGEFHKFGGTIDVVSEQPDRSSVRASINIASIDTKIRKRDDHLLGAEFFDASRFSEIAFRSRGIRRTTPDSGDIAGDVTMKGITRPLTLHAKLLTRFRDGEAPARLRFEVVSDPIHRKDFGLMFGSAAEAISGIGQDVSAVMKIEAVRQ